MNPTLVIHDVQERKVGNAKPPSFPLPTVTTTGFPEHNKKRSRVSAFKQKRNAQASGAADPATVDIKLPTTVLAHENDNPANGLSPDEQERRRIDQENRTRIGSMSPEEIEKAQQELLTGLDPSVIQMLLRRANLDEQNGPSPFNVPKAERPNTAPIEQESEPPQIVVEDTSKSAREYEASISTKGERESHSRRTKPPPLDEDTAPPQLPPNLFPVTSDPPKATTKPSSQKPATMHFPRPPQVPDLDPSDPDFLTNLHAKYFPDLPADPIRLAWMAPVPSAGSPADCDSPYYPGQASVAISSLRFDFRGALLPPALSRAVPTTRGLHHHGEAPEAAGYTVSELARLARSAVPAQRCLAFQTLGRVAFRLGKGEWGGAEDELARGIWSSFQKGRVLDSLNEAAAVPEGEGHRGSRAYAIEALWLFEKGGWKEKWRGR